MNTSHTIFESLNIGSKCVLTLLLVLACSRTFSDTPATISTVKIAAENWTNATNTDGSGVFFDLARRVYSSEGIDISYQIQTYKAAIFSIHRGTNDMLFGVASNITSDKTDGTLLSELPIYDEQILLICRKPANCKLDQSTLPADIPIAQLGGYYYDLVLGLANPIINVLNPQHALQLLTEGKIDYMLFDNAYLEAISKTPDFGQHYQHTEFALLVNFAGFASNDRGRYLKNVFDREMGKLLYSGELRKLYDHWNFPFPQSLQKRLQQHQNDPGDPDRQPTTLPPH